MKGKKEKDNVGSIVSCRVGTGRVIRVALPHLDTRYPSSWLAFNQMTRILLLDGASYKGAAELYRHPPGINAPPPSLTGLALLAFLPSF